MKTFVKILLTALFAVFAITPQAVSNSLSPFGVNIDGIDPGLGTADPADVFQDINDLETFEGKASEFVAPAWLEILVLVSPANFPISTFLTQKTLDGVRGLAKAQAASYASKNAGKLPDYLIKTDDGKTRFNQKYAVNQEHMKNYKQFTNESVANYKLNWGEIAVIPFQDTVTGAFVGGATSGTITVNNVNMWTRTCLLKVQGKEYGTGEELVVFVNDVNTTTNTLTLHSVASDGSENIPAIAIDDQITRMGSANPELEVKRESVSQSPVSDYNYAQKFITSVVYSNWLMMTQLFTNYSFSLITNLALQDFRYGQEFSFMFGLRGRTIVTKPGGGNETILTTGGLTQYIDQIIEYGTGGGNTTITETDIVDYTKQMRVGNNGSDTRYLFAGSELISSLNKGVMSDSTRFVKKDYDTVYGLSFTVLYSFFGTINVMYAPLMDQSDYRDRGFLLDMQFVDKFVFQPFRETNIKLWEIREADAEAIDMIETCGLVVRNTDTHFVMQVKA
jgi:hypothetical protein